MEPRTARVSRLGAGLLVLVCTCLLVPSGGSLTNVNAQGREGGFGRTSTIPLDPDSDRVGATAAEFRVDESGAATYSIPLYTVPGTAGVTPQISLNYSSQGGAGPLGKGWSIGGLSSISRCRATREAGDFITAGVPHDGIPKPILLDGNDRFCLDGQRLIEVSNSPACAGVSGMAVVQLRTEIESFQRVCAYTPTSGNTGAAFFTVERKDGSISWYGDRSANAGPNRPDGYVNSTAPDRTGVAIAWAQTRFQDSTGNYIDFTYHESPNAMVGEHLLAEVRFTGKVNLAGQAGPTLNPYAKMQFNYELLPTQRHEKGYVAGGLVTRGHRLQNVVSCATIACNVADQARYYRLLYAPSPSGSTLDGLTSIQECRDQGMGVCLDPTVFTWSTAKHEFATSESPTGLPAVGSAFRGYKLADIDGDGRQDLVYLRDGNASCSTDWLVVGFAKLDSLGRPTWEFMTPRCLPARIRDRGDGAWHLFDYDGDGRDDLMVSAAVGSSWHLYASVGRSGNGFSSTNLLATTPILSQSGAKDQVQIADLNGDGLVDVVYPVGTSLMARMMTRTEGGFRFGLQVPVGVDASSLPPWPDFCAEFGNTCTRTISGSPTTRTNHVQMADFNGDAASDLLVRVGTYMRYRVEGVPGCTPRLIHGQQGAARLQGEDEDIPYVLDMDQVRDALRRQVPPEDDPCWEVSQSDQLHAFTAHNNAGASITLRNHAAVAGGNPAAITFGDSNGDGLTDLFVQEAVNGDWRLSVNTGKLFIIGLILNVPDFRQHARFQDINGDGRTDLLYVVNDSAGRGYRVRFARPGGGFEAIGQMLPGGNRALICEGGGCNVDERIPMFADLDGDGALDFTSMRFTSSPLMYVSRAASRFTPRDTIVKVTNGMGAQTQVRYQPMTNVDIHRRASGTRDTTNWGRGSPVTDFIAPMYVVERASSTSPQHGAPDAMATVYYRYANARIQAGGRGFLGFGRIETIDPNQGSGHVATTTDYAQNFPFVGMPMQTVKRVVAGAFTPGACRNGTITDACFAGPGAHPALGGSTFSDSMQDWEADTDIGSGATVAFAAGVQAPVHVRTTGTVETARDPWAGGTTSTVATAFVYAGYGNVTQTAVDTYTGANTLLSTVTTANTYAQDSVAKWRLGRLTASEVTHARPGTTPVVRKTRFWYDMTGPATGLLLNTRVENPDGYDLRTEYSYDVFGNRTAEATCTDNLASCDLSLLQFKPANIRTVHRYRETRYESIGNGRFPRATWEPFWDASGGDLEPVGMVTARNIFGQPTQVEDENGVVTVAVSGTLGREYFTWQQTEPGGATPANGGVGSWVAHRWCGTTGVSCPTGAVVRTRKFTTGAPLQWTYTDALGRPVMQATQTMNADVSGKDVSATCTAYDAAGRPAGTGLGPFLPVRDHGRRRPGRAGERLYRVAAAVGHHDLRHARPAARRGLARPRRHGQRHEHVPQPDHGDARCPQQPDQHLPQRRGRSGAGGGDQRPEHYV